MTLGMESNPDLRNHVRQLLETLPVSLNQTTKMPTYNVTLPITGIICTTVEANSEEEAIEKALNSELSTDDIQEWNAHKQIVQGNVFHGVCNDAEASQEE